MTSMEQLQQRAFTTAQEKGWWSKYQRFSEENPDANIIGVSGIRMTAEELFTKLGLIVTEVAEAMECVRTRQFRYSFGPGGKPEGLPSELADIVIRVMDTAAALGYNLEHAVTTKMDFNDKRSFRHGGKSV